MPVRFLSDVEREQLSRFPATISPEDCLTHFTLSFFELAKTLEHRGDHNRLGFALQLCALRYLGFSPDDLLSAPAAAVRSLAHQLAVPPDVLTQYGARVHTRTDHLQEIQAYLGFRDATPRDLTHLEAWLVERAVEHDRPTLLLSLAAERLLNERIVRPGVARLERLVATAREQAQKETFRQVGTLLTADRVAALDQLLLPDRRFGRTPLAWLRQGAVANTPPAILSGIEKLLYLCALEVDTWDLGALTPNRQKFLAQVGRKSTSQAWQRAPAQRRYPVLLAFLCQALEEITDETVDLFDACLAHAYNRAGHDLEEFRHQVARATNAKVVLFDTLARAVLDPTIPDAEVRPRILREIPPERLRAELDETQRLIRPLDDNYFDFLAQRYGYLRQFTPKFLAAFAFRSHDAHDPLLEAVAALRQLNASSKRKVPDDVPLAFVPPKWRPYVVTRTGAIDRHYYELCVLMQLRGALRAGNLWLEHSRRYADPETYLIPRARWGEPRPEVCRLVNAPQDGATRLRERQVELEELVARLETSLPHNPAVRLEDETLVVSPLRAEELPERVQQLQGQLAAALPLTELVDLLIEVDELTHFSDCLVHAGGSEPRTRELKKHLYAAILAQARNFGVTRMAQLAELSYEQLVWCTDWYLREETLRPAVASIVNYHYHLPLSQVWGGGTLSSSERVL
jgi:TnpA family transposase